MRQLFTLVLAITWCFTAMADTFIVTSNADNGPGTLREAITLANANGTVGTDYIHFNITSLVFNQRIINIKTQLPDLSSNIVIDGTTQLGETYGTTEAKICIKMDLYAPSFSMISIKDAQYVEIYGLLLYYGYWQGFFGSPSRSPFIYGINISNSQHVSIGGPYKGNVITGVVHAIFSSVDSCSDIRIKSNYLGGGAFYSSAADDIDVIVLNVECGITMASVNNITIGGAAAAEGNVFGSSRRAINIDSRKVAGNGWVMIRNNIFGRKYDKITLLQVSDFWDNYISIGRSRNNPVNYSLDHITDYKVIVLDNNISSHMSINRVSDSIIIKRNSFEEDMRNSRQTVKLGIAYTTGIGILGGDDPADANIFKKKGNSDNSWSVMLNQTGPFTMLRNIYECNTSLGSTTFVSHYNNRIPYVQVDSTSTGFTSGRATAGSRVDLYYDDYCTGCEGNIYITSVLADEQGKWSYTGSVTGTIVATATSTIGYTSKFSEPIIYYQNAVVQQPTCGGNNGSITNMTSEGADAYFWLKYPLFDTVSHSIDLLNAGPGYYTLYAVHGGTCVAPCQKSYQLDDVTPSIKTNNSTIFQPSCGRFNGAITGVYVNYSSNSSSKWINSLGQTIGTKPDITGLGQGTYRFVVKDSSIGGGCTDTASFVLVNQSGPELNMMGMLIKTATCGNSNGSITGITASNTTGTASYRWLDSLNNISGNTKDLLNVPPGKYRLTFKDASSCDTIVTPFYVVPDLGAIKIDTSGKLVTQSSCSVNTGSITQLTVTGGETFTWTNIATNTVSGNTVNVFNLPAGSYSLQVNNGFGCSKISPVIIVSAAAFSQINVKGFSAADAFCNKASGFIRIDSFSKSSAGYQFIWTDSISGLIKGTGWQLNNLPKGTYLLLATDSNGCEQKIFNYNIGDAMPVIDDTRIQVKNEQCSMKDAGITGLLINNLASPTVYTWYNQGNSIVGNTLNLQNVGAGTYLLKITTGGSCNIESRTFTITNQDNALTAPVYDDLIIPRYSSAVFNIRNPSAGNYKLMTSASGNNILQQNSSGNFTINNITSDTSFYIRKVNGSCESKLVKVNVKVVDRSFFAIPSAFTPNNDGLNDRLSVKVVGYIVLNHFRIYNRWGQLVFETRELNTGWDGKYKGTQLNTGNFVWVAEGKDIKGNIIKDRGSFILIR
jgi:gliding motility-associated-like protein